MKNGKKLVNITPVFPITSTNPPIRVPVKRVYMKPDDIRKCIIARAKVEEILSDGTTIRLGMSSCFTDNEPNKVENQIIETISNIENSINESEEPVKQTENRFDRKHSRKWRKQHQREIQDAAKHATDNSAEAKTVESEDNQSYTDETNETVPTVDTDIAVENTVSNGNTEIEAEIVEETNIETRDAENI